MENQSKEGKDPKAVIKLTDEQREELSNVFGKELVSRLQSIEVEQLAGYLKANAHVN